MKPLLFRFLFGASLCATAVSANAQPLFRVSLAYLHELQQLGEVLHTGPIQGWTGDFQAGQAVRTLANDLRSTVTLDPPSNSTRAVLFDNVAVLAQDKIEGDPVWTSKGLMLTQGSLRVVRSASAGPKVRICTSNLIIVGNNDGKLYFDVGYVPQVVNGQTTMVPSVIVYKGSVEVYVSETNSSGPPTYVHLGVWHAFRHP